MVRIMITIILIDSIPYRIPERSARLNFSTLKEEK